jgi:hypothetical protein
MGGKIRKAGMQERGKDEKKRKGEIFLGGKYEIPYKYTTKYYRIFRLHHRK